MRAYTGGSIINGDKDKEVIKVGVIIVDDEGNISAVGSADDTPIPTGCEVVDLSDKYIMPGLINAHVHLFSGGGPRKSLAGGSTEKLFKLLSTYLGKKIVASMYKKQFKTALHSGVTTARDVGSLHNMDLKYKKQIAAGKIEGPRLVCCGGLITTTGGHGSMFPGSLVVDGADQCLKAVRIAYHNGVDWIKICNTGGVTDAKFIGEAGMPHMTVDEIKTICTEAHRRNLMVASHCESTQGIRDCLEAGVDTIEHGAAIEEDMLPLFRDNKNTLRGYVSLIPTISAATELYNNREYMEQDKAHEIIFENAKIVADGCISGLKMAVQSGIKVAVGTDAAVPFVAQYKTYKELVYFKEHTGLTNAEVIDIATKQTAEIINVDSITGTLDTGKAADFIVLTKDPLADLNNIKKPVGVVTSGRYISSPSFKEIKGIEL